MPIPKWHCGIGLGLKIGALCAQVIDRRHGAAQLGQPFLGVFTDQLDRPRECVSARSGYTGVDQRVEHLAFRLFQACHHRYCNVSEQNSLTANLDAPGNLASEAILRFIGDVHSL